MKRKRKRSRAEQDEIVATSLEAEPHVAAPRVNPIVAAIESELNIPAADQSAYVVVVQHGNDADGVRLSVSRAPVLPHWMTKGMLAEAIHIVESERTGVSPAAPEPDAGADAVT